MLWKGEKSMSKTLVAYFSASGVTEKVAKRLATATGADLYEIKPETPYSKADLNWMDKKSRSSVEMNDKSSRPAIGNKIENMDQYENVFVGFPMWWYREPSIIDTFIESYNFDGKKVITFATSGGSGMGDSVANLQALAKGAKVIDGKKFSNNISEEELAKFANELI